MLGHLSEAADVLTRGSPPSFTLIHQMHHYLMLRGRNAIKSLAVPPWESLVESKRQACSCIFPRGGGSFYASFYYFFNVDCAWFYTLGVEGLLVFDRSFSKNWNRKCFYTSKLFLFLDINSPLSVHSIGKDIKVFSLQTFVAWDFKYIIWVSHSYLNIWSTFRYNFIRYTHAAFHNKITDFVF